MNALIHYSWGITFHPVRTLTCYLKNTNKLTHSLITVLLFSITYTIGVLLAYLFGHQPYGIPIVLNISIEEYYLYESFFLLPITLCTWVMFSGFIQIIAIPFGGKGSFEDTLALTGLPYIILIIFMFIPDLITDYYLRNSIASEVYWKIINPLRLTVVSLWVMAVHCIAVKLSQKLTLIKAIIVTVLSYIPYMAITLTYIR